MINKLYFVVLIILTSSTFAFAQGTSQNTNSASPSTRTRTLAPKPSPTPSKKDTGADAPTASQTQRPKSGESSVGGQTSSSGGVVTAFNSLLDGIRHADVKAVTNGYQNSTRLVLFNNNGTVT